MMNMWEMKQLFNLRNVNNLGKSASGKFWRNETMDKFNKLDQNTIPRSDAIDRDEKVEQWMKTFNFLY
jgi:hypothetical protein